MPVFDALVLSHIAEYIGCNFDDGRPEVDIRRDIKKQIRSLAFLAGIRTSKTEIMLELFGDIFLSWIAIKSRRLNEYSMKLVLSSPIAAYYHAMYSREDRWEEAENVIKESPHWQKYCDRFIEVRRGNVGAVYQLIASGGAMDRMVNCSSFFEKRSHMGLLASGNTKAAHKLNVVVNNKKIKATPHHVTPSKWQFKNMSKVRSRR